MSFIIDLIEEIVPITGIGVVDTVLFGIANLLALLIAFDIIGTIFDFFGKYDSKLMSDMHWGIRIVVFVALVFLFIKIFEFINWLFSFKWWIYLIVFLVLIGIIFLVFYLKYRYSKKKNANRIQTEEFKVVEAKEEIIEQKPVLIYNRDYCPRCGGRLVKRHGPFGDFYGCSNYSKSNCRYTRRYK